MKVEKITLLSKLMRIALLLVIAHYLQLLLVPFVISWMLEYVILDTVDLWGINNTIISI